MAGIIDDLKNTYKTGGALTKLIYINSAVFIVGRIIYLFYAYTNPLAFPLTSWFSVPSDPVNLMYRPWTLLTYMFYHEDPLHFFFNVLNLYWLGKIFLIYFDDKKLVSVYLLGGLLGGIVYFAFYSAFPAAFGRGLLMGASGSIIALLVATAIYAPNLRLNMFFVGEIKLIYLALFYIVLSVILLSSINAGGNFAHLGGALFGYIWAKQYMRGREITKGFSKFTDSIAKLFKPRKLKVAHKRFVDDLEYNKQKNINQKEIDRILDKISKSGYNGLTQQEKDTLFKVSNKNN